MSSTNYFKILCAVFFLLAGLSACSESGRPLLQVGEQAPPFTLDLLDGEQSRLELYSGKGLVITFMSSWCPCSNDSMPLMNKAYLDHKDDIAFLMIGIQDARSKFEKFVNKWEVPFPTGYDKGEKIARDYGISSPPTTIFIDKTGTVTRAFYGNIAEKEQEFPQWIEELL